MSTLYIVGTPIGNLEDITIRAVRVLSGVDVVLCEDTRVTKKLLLRHDIKAKTMSYHAHSRLSRVDEIIRMLGDGMNVALVSDAGTPGISDPGAELVSQIRRDLSESMLKGDVRIESVPGPSALTAALSIAGVPCASFVFLGFLPHKKGRETLFKEIALDNRTVVFYESPHRILKTLNSLVDHLSSKSIENPKTVTICRELTKIYEQVVSGTSDECLKYFDSHPDKVKGEFVVIVSHSIGSIKQPAL